MSKFRKKPIVIKASTEKSGAFCCATPRQQVSSRRKGVEMHYSSQFNSAAEALRLAFNRFQHVALIDGSPGDIRALHAAYHLFYDPEGNYRSHADWPSIK